MVETNIMPKISIIVPVYNVEKYLSTCLDSLINQTLKDIEIICVNDGSTDNSLNILNEYAKNDPRIIVINKENSGPGACRNLGIEKATGEYIQFADSDDWIEKETCEICYQKAIEYNVNMLSFNANEIHTKKTFPIHYYNTKTEKLLDFEEVLPLLFKSPFHSWHYLFKKEFLIQNNIKFPENIFLCEDVIFTLTCWLNTKKTLLLPNIFYNYIQYENSITHSSKYSLDIFDVIKKIKQIIFNSKKENLLLEKEVFQWSCYHLLGIYKKLNHPLEIKKFKTLAHQTNCLFEYQEMLKKFKNPTHSFYCFKLFGILPIFSVNKKNNIKRYKLFSLPILSIKKNENTTCYLLFKICLAKIIRK